VSNLAVSLAVLKVNWDKQGADFLENYVPFVIDCISAAPQAEVSLLEVHEALIERFALQVPLGPLKTILRRLARRDIVRRCEGIYIRNTKALPATDLLSQREEALRRHAMLVERFVTFLSEALEENVTGAEASARLDALVEQWAVPLLETSFAGQRAPTHGMTEEQYPTQAFVRHLCEADPDGFDYLVEIIKGSVLANAVFFADIGPVGKHFAGTRVFLDTRIVLRVLGYAGPELQSPYSDLVDLLYATGARVRCFDTTLREATRVLEVNARHLRTGGRGAFGETFTFLSRHGYTSSDVLLRLARMDRDLRALRIDVESVPAHVPELTVDELKLESTLRSVVGYVSDTALLHDLNVITAICALRGGTAPLRVEEAKAVFVTTNTALVAAAKRFATDSDSGVGQQAPLCLADHTISTIAWLKQPVRAPDLPREMVIADCFAALNPSDALWREYLAEIEKLEQLGEITRADYEILRYAAEAESVLMDVTMGDPDAFAEGTVRQVLERAKETISREALEERDAAQAEAQEARQDADRLRHERAEQERAIHYRASRLAHWFVLLTGGLVTVLLVVGLVLSLPTPLADVGSHLPQVVVFIVLAAVTAMVFGNLIWGTTLRGFLRSLELAVQNRVGRVLRRLLLPPSAE
jgi:hypothetical protein